MPIAAASSRSAAATSSRRSVRKFEAKPIRAYLTTGMRDMENCAGDWFLLDQEMDKALKFSGYDYFFRIINGGHGAGYYDYFREAMSYLWKDWPEPVKAGAECSARARHHSARRARGNWSPRIAMMPVDRRQPPTARCSSWIPATTRFTASISMATSKSFWPTPVMPTV